MNSDQCTALAAAVFTVGAFLFAHAYILFPLMMKHLGRMQGRSIRRDPEWEPVVSIFIPAYNEERVIAAKIENTLALDYPPEKLEILVCSDCSSDRTNDIVQEYVNTYPQVTLNAYTERSGKTGMINKAVPAAAGDIVVLSDANTMYDSQALRSIVSAFSAPDIGAVLGNLQLYVADGVSGLDKEVTYRAFEADIKNVEGLYGCAMGAFGGFYAIRKSAFEPLPANAYSNDDFLIPLRMIQRGMRVVFDAQARAEEETGETVSEEFGRRIRIGAGNFQSFSLLPGMLNPFRIIRFFFYFSHKVLRWFSPFILLVLFISNAFLLELPLFRQIFGLQVVFYGIALIGAVLDRFDVSLPGVRSIYHFVSMNAALFLGFFRFARGIKSAVWSSTERAEQ
ncbi:MAG: glycosyltransferase family 2 protein [Fibrobacterota bacterium]